MPKRSKWIAGEDAPDREPDSRYKDSAGYVVLMWNEPDAYLQVREHSVVMKAKRGQQVHHVNHVRDDNRPENLELYENFEEHLQAHGSDGAWRKLPNFFCKICGAEYRPMSAKDVICSESSCVQEHRERAAKLANKARWAGHVKMTEEERIESARASRRKYKERKRRGRSVSVPEVRTGLPSAITAGGSPGKVQR